MKHEFKKGDIVTIGEHGTKQWKLITKHGAKLWLCQSLSSGKRNLHRVESFNLVKPEPKQDRSELYKLLPRVSKWPKWANWVCVNGDAIEVLFCQLKPSIKTKMEYWTETSREGSVSFGNTITLPPSINWKDTLVSREEMEVWEKSQVRQNEMFLHTTTPVGDYYRKLFEDSFTETPQQKVERLKLELEEAEKELEKVTPVQFKDASISSEVFIGMTFAPPGLSYKCLMFNSDHHRMEQSTHNQYTVLTFFKK